MVALIARILVARNERDDLVLSVGEVREVLAAVGQRDVGSLLEFLGVGHRTGPLEGHAAGGYLGDGGLVTPYW